MSNSPTLSAGRCLGNILPEWASVAVLGRFTGRAQVRHRYGSSVEDSLHKLHYDLFNIKNMCSAFDLFVRFETVETVIVRVES